MKYYIFSDPHYDHTNVIAFCQRPQNYEDLIFKSTRQVPEGDCLICLGDICIGDDTMVHEKFIKPLKCRKILVKGNHDTKSYSWYMEHGWDFVCDSFKIRYGGYNVCLSHRPQGWDGDWDINIHGHLHNLARRKDEYPNLKQWNLLYAPELERYQVIELAKFIQREG